MRPTAFVEPSWAVTPQWTTVVDDPGQPIAESSPVPVTLDGVPAVVVGDRKGELYALSLASGGELPGWPADDGSGPIDSTPSVVAGPAGPLIAVGTGNDAQPTVGGYQAFTASGVLAWFTRPADPATDAASAVGVQAGLTVADETGGASELVVAGSLGQEAYALDATTGVPARGWPFFTSDSTHSTAAAADLFGTGRQEIVDGADQSTGTGRGQTYTDGGHLRIWSTTGQLICRADTTQVVDSSPAVGGFLPGGATGIVVGTGSFFPGASDSDLLVAFDTHCQRRWSLRLDGATSSSPALADLTGDGQLDVVEGTDQGPGTSGSVYAVDAATGQVIWEDQGLGRVIGSPVAADLSGTGAEDVVVPVIGAPGQPSETDVLDGRTGRVIAHLAVDLGVQNAPLVTEDPDGDIGITIAGYSGAVPGGQGVVEHYELPATNGAAAVGSGSWPMFHHDPQLTGDAGGTPAPGSVPACDVPAGALGGYDLVGADGGVFTFGGRPFCGSMGGRPLNAPVVGAAAAPARGGYWEVAADGGVFTFGDARFYGPMGGRPLNAPMVAMAATPDGGGYWEVAADGGVFCFGDAQFYGSMGGRPLNAPIVGMAATADGKGYWLVAADGGIFAFGDAPFLGSMGGRPLAAPMVGMAPDTSTGGYWEVAADGGVFAFSAPFLGSMGGRPLAAPVVGIASGADGTEYRLVAADGGVFTFGGASFLGSMGGRPLAAPMVAMVGA